MKLLPLQVLATTSFGSTWPHLIINALLDADADRKLGESPIIFMDTKILNTPIIIPRHIQAWIPGFVNLDEMPCVPP